MSIGEFFAGLMQLPFWFLLIPWAIYHLSRAAADDFYSWLKSKLRRHEGRSR